MLHPIQIKYEISFHRIRYHLEHVSKYSRHFYMLSTKNIFGQSSIHLTILEIGLCSLNSIHLLTLNHKIFSYFSWLLWFVEKLCNQIPPHMLLIGMDEIYWKNRDDFEMCRWDVIIVLLVISPRMWCYKTPNC